MTRSCFEVVGRLRVCVAWRVSRSGYTCLHMAVRGTAERRAVAKGRGGREAAEKEGRRMVAFLLDHDAFVDSLDRLCRCVEFGEWLASHISKPSYAVSNLTI